MKNTVKPILFASAAVLSWSTVATAFKVALRHMSVYEMVLVAACTALVIFGLRVLFTGQWREITKLKPEMWLRFALLGFVMPVGYYLVLFRAYDYLPAQIAQPVNYVWPILLAFMLAIYTRKPIPGIKYLGMLISLAGVVAISMGGADIEGGISPFGLVMAIGSAMLWAIYWIINDSLKNYTSDSTALFLSFMFGVIYLAIGLIWNPVSSITIDGLFAGMYIGAFEMGIPFICFGIAIRTTNNPTLVNQMCYLAPFLSLFFISFILGEPIMWTTYLGLVLIIGGLVFNQLLADRITGHCKLSNS